MTLPRPNDRVPPQFRECNSLSRRAFLGALAATIPVHRLQHQVGRPRHRYDRRIFPAADQRAVGGVRHEVWTARPELGSGPDVIVLHEITGATDLFFAYTDTLVDAGFS